MYIQNWELHHKADWGPKKWCFWTVVLEKTLEMSLDCKEIKPVNPKGNQAWIITGRTDAKAPIPWPPDVKSQLIGKAGKDWGQRRRGRQSMRSFDSITDSLHKDLTKLWEIVKDKQAWLGAFYGVAKKQDDLRINNNHLYHNSDFRIFLYHVLLDFSIF